MWRSVPAGYRLACLLGPLVLACGPDTSDQAPIDKNSPPPTAAPDGAEQPADSRPTMVFLGTSLTAGLGLSLDQAYPALVQAKLDSAGLAYRVVNAGVSGETSAGALRRIDWLFSQGTPAVLVVETGANDGLRGQSPDSLRANLEAILAAVDRLEPRPQVFLAAMEALPNLGADYGRRFRAVYQEVAAAHRATLIPFFLADVAGVDSLNQADGIHPNPAGARRAADNMWTVLGPALQRAP